MNKLKSENRLTLIFNLLIGVGILSSFISPENSDQQVISKAYLDPSTGSMIISAIVGVLATIVLGLKTFWYKITGIFKGTKKQTNSNDTSINK